MPKIERGRLNGIDGITSFTSVELFVWADELENQIKNPNNQDDTKWLQRWADKIRHLAVKKDKSKFHKDRQR